MITNLPVSNIKGIRNIKSQDLIKTKYILTELKHSNSGYIQDADSMKVFAIKAIENIKKQYH